MKHALSLLCSCMVVALLGLPAQAQEFGGLRDVDATGIAYHKFVRPGESTVQVLVLGTVGSPGIYEVGEGTDLGELIGMAGGTGLGPRERRETRDVTVRLFRQEGGRRALVYEESWEQMVVEIDQYPAIRSGDVLTVDVVVETRERFGWRDVLSLVTSLAGLIIAADQLAHAFD